MKTRRIVQAPRTSPSSVSSEEARTRRVAAKAETDGALPKAPTSAPAAKAETSASAPPPEPSALARAQRLLGDAARTFARDPVGTTFKGLTVCLALAATTTQAQSVPRRASETEPLPGAELDSVRTRWARPGFERTMDITNLPSPLDEPIAAVMAKRKGYEFESRGVNPGGLGRRR